jgi:RNA polymerase sigma factor (sigma-70 family)
MDERQIRSLLQGLGSQRPQEAWERFLKEYSSTIFQIIRFSERNPDHISDCFVFVCEQLSRNRFRRLRQFRLDGPATFSTWLHAVVRRLYLDWRRKEFGRYRIFQSVAKLSGFDQAVFQLVYEQGTSPEQSLLHLSQLFPDTTNERFMRSLERIQRMLTPRQRWLLSMRSANTSAVGAKQDEEEVSLVDQVPDSLPDPASLAAKQEELNALSRVLSGLAKRDRLLIRLRFEQEFTLEQVARLMKFGDAQSADRQIRRVLEQLRQKLGQ